jgi:catechol 2,3-dioxygenase-like lactoylglutathione lyase family enzyme
MKMAEAAKGKLRHIGIACKDPEATAVFYEEVFGMRRIGAIAPEHPHASGIYLTDGVMNITVIRFKTVEYAGEDYGLDFVGVHHIGFEIEDHDATRQAIESGGGRYMWAGGRDHQKYRDPNNIILEVTAKGFATTPEVAQSNATLPPDVKR